MNGDSSQDKSLSSALDLEVQKIDEKINENLLFQSQIETEGPQPVNTGFFHGFVASFSVIIVSELGDKTFFIAAIMAMRHPRLTVFIGAISALALMTILSGICKFISTFH